MDKDRQTDGQTDRQMDRQTDGQTDGNRTDRQTDRQGETRKFQERKRICRSRISNEGVSGGVLRKG